MNRTKIYILIIFTGMVLTGIVLSSCSPKMKYDTLSIFFDGVPNPDEKKVTKADSVHADSSKIVVAENSTKTNFIHPPYEDHNCSGCHNDRESNKVILKQPELCYQCHEDFSGKYKIVHGPAASGYCTECHNPHTSVNPSLLTDNSQRLCLKCHVKSDIEKNEIHNGIGSTVCWDCHSPHGGSDRTLMK